MGDEQQLEAVLGGATQRQQHLEELTAALGTYAEVRDMAQLPGWGSFITELQRRSVEARKEVEDLMDLILLGRTQDKEELFREAKIRLLALEEAIQIYLKIRERAKDAKEVLDAMPAEVALSN